MRKFLLLLMIFVLGASNCSYAGIDLWDNFMDKHVYGQKAVTDEQFDKALESKKEKPKKQKDKLLRDGEPFQESNETTYLNEMPKEYPILLIPLNLQLKDDAVLPVGHYQVHGEKKDGKFYLKLYQAYTLMASLEAIETNNDFGEEEITFVKLIESGENAYKIIYGSIDFNAYVYVQPER